ncbi:MAG: ribokinase [Isosphaeraceae bacterium]|nr:ribokinase [Isosphaeraceae bacterium]
MSKIVVLGSSGFDLAIRLPRLPRPGETLLGGELHTGPGGKGANAAIAARRAGAEVVFLTAFGDDDFGRHAAENSRAEGIDLRFAKIAPGVANQVALIFVDASGRNLIGVAPGASAQLTPVDIDRLPVEVFDPSAVFLTCLEVPIATVARGLRRARAAGLTTVLNPAPADRSILEGDLLADVDILTPNQEEARALTGLAADTPDEVARAAATLQARGARVVIVTLGEAGCLVVSGQGTRHVAGCPVEVVDTVGAGDAFNGALATALAEGRPLAEAAHWACAAGAFAVTRPGAQGALPRREEIDRIARMGPGRG